MDHHRPHLSVSRSLRGWRLRRRRYSSPSLSHTHTHSTHVVSQLGKGVEGKAKGLHVILDFTTGRCDVNLLSAADRASLRAYQHRTGKFYSDDKLGDDEFCTVNPTPKFQPL